MKEFSHSKTSVHEALGVEEELLMDIRDKVFSIITNPSANSVCTEQLLELVGEDDDKLRATLSSLTVLARYSMLNLLSEAKVLLEQDHEPSEEVCSQCGSRDDCDTYRDFKGNSKTEEKPTLN